MVDHNVQIQVNLCCIHRDNVVISHRGMGFVVIPKHYCKLQNFRVYLVYNIVRIHQQCTKAWKTCAFVVFSTSAKQQFHCPSSYHYHKYTLRGIKPVVAAIGAHLFLHRTIQEAETDQRQTEQALLETLWTKQHWSVSG